MNLLKTTHILLVVGSLFLLTGCVKDQDFDQADEIVITPEVETDLVYLTLRPENFVKSDGEVVGFVNQVTNLDFLREAFIQRDLTRIDFVFKTENSFSDSFNTFVSFLDANGNETYSIDFSVPSGSNGDFTTYIYTEIVEGENLQNVKNAVRLEITSSISQSGQPIAGELNFQSKARFYFELN